MATKESLIRNYLNIGKEKGFLNISLQDIADYEGIKKPSILSHFKSYEDLKEQAVLFCCSTLEQKQINVDFNQKSLREMIESLLANFIEAFSDPVLASYLSLLNQMEEISDKYRQLSEKVNMMIKSRLTVALDYSNQRSWTDIADTDTLSVILCPFIREIMIKNELPDWELSNMIKSLCFILTSSQGKEFQQG